MKQLLKIFTKKTIENILFYILGLVLNKEKNTCTKIANFFGINHDRLYRVLCKTDIIIRLFPDLMVSIANNFSKTNKGWLIIDDTTIIKSFARFLPGVFTVYDVILGRSDRGFKSIVIAWSNGEITIPLSFEWMFHKDITGKYYKTKTQIAKQLILYCKDRVKFEYILFDAHYTTEEMIRFLDKQKIKFCGKIPCNRNIKNKNGNINQLKHYEQLKLIKNERSKKMLATYKNVKLYFSVHKRKNKNNEYTFVYIVSNMNFDAKVYLEIYEQRWCIEKMFRTMKQLLGFSHCISIDLDRQKAHMYFIFFAYSFLENEKYDQKLSSPEVAGKYLRDLKFDAAMARLTSFRENFLCFA